MSTNGLKQRFMRAAGWTIVGHGLAQIIRLASNLVLTRLLAPELYGVMAVGYVVITGLVMFTDIGLGSGTIQNRRGDDPKFLNVTWIMQIAQGTVVTLGALVLAGGLKLAAVEGWLPPHSVYADPQVPLLIAVISLSGIASGFESTRTMWARRHLSLGSITKIELSCQIGATIVQLCWAAIAPSLWTLAGGWLFATVMKTVLTHVALPGPANRFEWDRSAFQEVFHFGKWVFLSSSFSFLLTSGDRILLGGFLDSKAMGYYTIALLLVNALQVAVLRVVGNAVLPALSEVYRERPNQLRQTIYKVRRPLDFVCLVSAGALVALGQPIIKLLYDSRYAESGWMLSVLALTLVATRLDVFDQCLIAMGRIKRLSMLNGVRLITLYAVVPLGYLVCGAKGAVGAVALSSLINATVVLTLQGRMGLLDMRRELFALPLFAAGALSGWAVLQLIHLAT